MKRFINWIRGTALVSGVVDAIATRVSDYVYGQEEALRLLAEARKPRTLHSRLAALGQLSENQTASLGFVQAPPLTNGGPEERVLYFTVTRPTWVKSILVDSDAPALVLVSFITISGLPMNIGDKGAPASMFAVNSTRWGFAGGARFMGAGTQIRVGVCSIDAASSHAVSGGAIVDELRDGLTLDDVVNAQNEILVGPLDTLSKDIIAGLRAELAALKQSPVAPEAPPDEPVAAEA